jgi:hypothetical protein
MPVLNISYYESSIAEFCIADRSKILGVLTEQHRFALEHQQRFAWQVEIELMQRYLHGQAGQIYFEFAIPRMGKRADVVILAAGVIFVVEFKVGSNNPDRGALEQVEDYALDLKNFHKGSHTLPVLPVLVPTELPIESVRGHVIAWATDKVAKAVFTTPSDLPRLICEVTRKWIGPEIDCDVWSKSGYHPTPTIVEAAQALYRDHDVSEISRSDAGARNLAETNACINQIIENSKANGFKSICFVTGVPGAGKTLAGLNIATLRAMDHPDENAVFLSGNGPLVDVLREALARDQSSRDNVSKQDAHRQVASFIQNIHHFRDDSLRTDHAPVERVVIFDEAQRAWNRSQTSKFMQQKRGHLGFDMSEPNFLINVMDRHTNWCVVICLIGGGQEINTGEAGLAEWLNVVVTQFPKWKAHISDRIRESVRDAEIDGVIKKSDQFSQSNALHLGVSMRSFRAESLSEFVGHIVENRPDAALQAYEKISHHYPIFITRELSLARSWLKNAARGSERFGLVVSSGGARLRPEGIFVEAKIDAPIWFLNGRDDVRSSYFLEEVGTEFDVQGLELDWTGVCWDADFRYQNGDWQHYKFRGASWQKVNTNERREFHRNAYRVILTRARQGMVIFVPKGDPFDATRPPNYYDGTYLFLTQCGLKPLPPDIESAPSLSLARQL